MKNSLGNPARGDAFYPRNKEIERLYRVLNTGASIYLSAPRRVGKTSILKFIDEFPKEGYYFVYVITESVDSKNEFFKVIFEGILNSDAIYKLSKVSVHLREGITGIMDRIKKIYNVELREKGETDYYELLVELFFNVKNDLGHLVIQIDEFPQTIQNILNKSGKEAAQRFIQKNRELRHHRDIAEKIQFIYTGSLSLFPMVEQVTQLTAINDLRTVELRALSPAEAIDFLGQLLQEEGIVLNSGAMEYVILKMKWLIPFHLQLIAQELIEVYETDGEKLGKVAVEKAFDQVVHVRNRPQFEPYFARLRSLFKGTEYAVAIDLLKHIAIHDSIDENEIHNLSVKYNIQNMQKIMNILEGDGYLYNSQEDRQFHYTSPILQLWCKKHMCP